MKLTMKNKIRIVITNETILALLKRLIVLMAETIKIFSLKKSEYNPKAYKEVIKNLDNSLSGTSV